MGARGVLGYIVGLGASQLRGMEGMKGVDFVFCTGLSG